MYNVVATECVSVSMNSIGETFAVLFARREFKGEKDYEEVYGFTVSCCMSCRF